MLNRNERVHFPFGILFIVVGFFAVLRFALQYTNQHESAQAGPSYWAMFAICVSICYPALYFPIMAIISLLTRDREDRFLLILGIILIPVSIGLECLIRVSTTLFTQGLFGALVLFFGILLAIEESRHKRKWYE